MPTSFIAVTETRLKVANEDVFEIMIVNLILGVDLLIREVLVYFFLITFHLKLLIFLFLTFRLIPLNKNV